MEMFNKYKSPLGYQTGENQIDSYGVDHSGFSTRDELEYQFARQNKENQLIQNYNNQGITKNYPQQGTNFWGNSDNNYGFGSSNIHDNIENKNNNPFENTVNTFGQNQTEQSYGLGSENQTFGQENNNSTQWGLNNNPLEQNNNNNTLSGNLFENNNLFNQNQNVWNRNQYQTQAPSRYNLKDLTDRLQQYQNNALGNSNSTFNSGLNNGSIFSPNNMQSLNLNASSALYPQQNSFSTHSQPYQLAQNSLPNSGSDVVSLQPYYNALPEYQLGMLSAKGETDNGKNLFNNCEADKTGGCSYGTYQIATGPGTMKDYLNYMKNKEEYKDFYNTLQQAGGFDAAKQGDDTFKSAWKNLSQNSEFLDSQHNFVLKNNYNTTINGINDIKGLNLDSRSPVIKDAIFSVSVQFGGKGGANLIHKALGNDASNLSDEDIINKIYDERGYKKYFKNSSENMQNSIKKNRSIDERQRALELLLKYPN